jgi:hypothetical protein
MNSGYRFESMQSSGMRHLSQPKPSGLKGLEAAIHKPMSKWLLVGRR